MTKALYRKRFIEYRDKLDKDFVNAAAGDFLTRFFDFFSAEELRGKTVMLYSSFRNEADTLPLIDSLKAAGTKVVLPRVDGSDLFPYYCESPDCMKKGSFGISEPDPEKCRPCDPLEIDMVIIPGLAFDEKGGRLGFGKGYYDRFLPKTGKDTLKIGLCYGFQLVSHALPTEPHDIFMDMILTESGLISCKKHSCTDL